MPYKSKGKTAEKQNGCNNAVTSVQISLSWYVLGIHTYGTFPNTWKSILFSILVKFTGNIIIT